MERPVYKGEQRTLSGIARPHRFLDHRIEHRREVAGR